LDESTDSDEKHLSPVWYRFNADTSESAKHPLDTQFGLQHWKMRRGLGITIRQDMMVMSCMWEFTDSKSYPVDLHLAAKTTKSAECAYKITW